MPQFYGQFPLFTLDEHVVGCTVEQAEVVAVDTKVTSQEGESAETDAQTTNGVTNIAKLQSQLRHTVASQFESFMLMSEIHFRGFIY